MICQAMIGIMSRDKQLMHINNLNEIIIKRKILNEILCFFVIYFAD